MSVKTIPLYAQYFPENGSKPTGNWENFKTKGADFATPLSERPADFSVDNRTWLGTAAHVAVLAVKVAVFSYIASPLIGRFIPPSITQALSPLQTQIAQNIPNAISKFPIPNAINKLQIPHVMSKISANVSGRTVDIALKGLTALLGLRYVMQRTAMIAIYPAQSRIVKFLSPYFAAGSFERVIGKTYSDSLKDTFDDLRTGALNSERKRISEDLDGKGFIMRDVPLEKDGIKYSGLLVGHRDTIENGQWALQATGNTAGIEERLEEFIEGYHGVKFNLLMVNGPSVGKSQGQAIPKTIGDAQEIGIRFIETALKAKKISIAGYSLGGAATGKAISEHDFTEGLKKGVKYNVISQMTFDRVSHIAAQTVGRAKAVISFLAKAVGCEMNTVAASDKVTELNIEHVIVNRTDNPINIGQPITPANFVSDGVIPPLASLGHALVTEGSRAAKDAFPNREFIGLQGVSHVTPEAVKDPTLQSRFFLST